MLGIVYLGIYTIIYTHADVSHVLSLCISELRLYVYISVIVQQVRKLKQTTPFRSSIDNIPNTATSTSQVREGKSNCCHRSVVSPCLFSRSKIREASSLSLSSLGLSDFTGCELTRVSSTSLLMLIWTITGKLVFDRYLHIATLHIYTHH